MLIILNVPVIQVKNVKLISRMSKNSLIFIIILILLLIGFLGYLWYENLGFGSGSKTMEGLEEREKNQEQKTGERFFEETLGHAPPKLYQKRLKIFQISSEKDTGFTKGLLLFPYPPFSVETLNILLWTKGLPEKRVVKVEGVVEFQEGKKETITFFPIKTIRKNERIEKAWLGAAENLSSAGKYPLSIKAYEKEGGVIDEIVIQIKIKE